MYPVNLGGCRMVRSFPSSSSIFQSLSFISPSAARHRATIRGALPLWLSLLCALLVVLAGCGSSSGPQTSNGPVTGGTLNVGLTSDVVTLDPLKSSALVDRQVMLNVYDTLVRVDAQNTVQPDLATSWSYTSPTQMVFTLRTDVKFTGGTSFDANAVVFNIDRILNTPTSPRFSELATVKSVVAIDASHV